MSEPTRDLRVRRFRPLVPPAILLEELPLSEAGAATVTRGRAEAGRILRGEDDRLIVVVGPCSVHDPSAGLDYAQRLRKLGDEIAADLCIVMRVYVETTGNADCHVILRGGHTGPNYDATHVQKVVDALRAADLPARIMIDTSHGNSSKDYRRQPLVARTVAEQIAAGEAAIVGLMME